MARSLPRFRGHVVTDDVENLLVSTDVLVVGGGSGRYVGGRRRRRIRRGRHVGGQRLCRCQRSRRHLQESAIGS